MASPSMLQADPFGVLADAGWRRARSSCYHRSATPSSFTLRDEAMRGVEADVAARPGDVSDRVRGRVGLLKPHGVACADSCIVAGGRRARLKLTARPFRRRRRHRTRAATTLTGARGRAARAPSRPSSRRSVRAAASAVRRRGPMGRSEQSCLASRHAARSRYNRPVPGAPSMDAVLGRGSTAGRMPDIADRGDVTS